MQIGLRGSLVFLFAITLPCLSMASSSCKLNKSEHVFTVTPTGPLKIHVFSPAEPAPKARAAILLFHGGGWMHGEPSWAFWLVDRFACKGLVTLVPQYRLSDRKTAAPAEAADDAMAAIKWVRDKKGTLGIDQNRIAALGWSAGAHLAASAAVFATDPSQRPNLLALVSPAVSVVNDRHFRSLFPAEMKIEEFSPAEHVRPGLPPTIIVTGSTDTVTPLAEVTKFHDRMTAAKNISRITVFDGVGHLFTPVGQPDNGYPKPDLAVQEKAYSTIDAFLVEHGYRAR